MAEARVAVDCLAVNGNAETLAFDLDFTRRSVTGAFPVNWSWFGRGTVMCGYSVLINGDYQTLQSYSVDLTTGLSETCDFAAGQQQACRPGRCTLKAL